MNITQMHLEFKLLMDKADAVGAPNFISAEIDRFLNAAIERFVSKRAFGNNPRRLGFEEDQKRRDDLRELITTHTASSGDFTSDDANKPGGRFVKLPDDYRHAINEESLLSYKDGGKSRVGVKPITHDRYNKIIDDPFNSPIKDSVYRLDYSSNSFEIIVPVGSTLSAYILRYLKNPDEVSKTDSKDCNLAKHTHREIVRMAVLEALSNIEDQRYQASKIELNEIE
tara:strand:+ start:283 stop:960 length:678 start_codon:yes stop_codon:yes gene_type:complete